MHRTQNIFSMWLGRGARALAALAWVTLKITAKCTLDTSMRARNNAELRRLCEKCVPYSIGVQFDRRLLLYYAMIGPRVR